MKFEVSFTISLKRSSDHCRGRSKDVKTEKVEPADLSGIHLVDGDNELTDAKSEGKKSVLASLAVLGNTRLELTGTTSDDEDGAVSLGGTGDHVLDEVTVARSIDDSDHVLGSLELPERNVDRDTTLTLGLQLVEHPCVLEGALAQLGGFLGEVSAN